MKFSALLAFICLSSLLHAQVTNLQMNRGDTTFSMTSGDTLQWEYDVPNGAIVGTELWFDANGNSVVEADSDALLAAFTQEEGNALSTTEYPDLDGFRNGHTVFHERAGLPAGKYILQFTHNGISVRGLGTIAALASPAHTVSGTVTPPAGKSARFILVQLDRAPGYGQIFWSALTDVAGSYTIAMNADTAGNPWHLHIAHNPYEPSFIVPAETLVTVTGNPANYNFTILNPDAIVRGYLTDDEGVPLQNSTIRLSRLSSNTDSVTFSTRTDTVGWFQIPIKPGSLNGSAWRIGQTRSGPSTTTTMIALGRINSILLGDTVNYSLIAYRTATTIGGQVLIDGQAPDPSLLVFATSVDVAESFVRTVPETGEFLIPVTDKFTSYTVHVDSAFAALYHVEDVPASPGDNSIFINISTTSVQEQNSRVPTLFILEQNYPNPFNPITSIEFQIAPRATGRSTPEFVSLKIFDLLGNVVSTIVNEELVPGTYTRTWDATGLPSGTYFCQLRAGLSGNTRKMILMR